MLTNEKVARLRRLIQEGLPVAHIAREIGCGRTRVYAEKRRMESKPRGTDRKPTLVRKSRPADPLGAFRERARKIELVERMRGIKKQAGDLASGSELGESEREALIALATQCDEAIDAMPSFSATDAALVSKELDARFGQTSRKVSSRIDLDHRLAVGRGRLGQLNRQLNALERSRQNRQREFRNLEEHIAALEHYDRAAEIAAPLVALVRQRAYTDWLREVTSSVPMTEVERNALEATFLRRRGLFEPNRG